eukprot:TRINITY_DN16943_c0_g1_i1.p1 TRINITY_DN16943_c0_g1~~TRINITY_DN16943_c0_g1_i1.p1  ORF type:complete len:632 (+),score=127.53 TRINITY_DN16943_c0_g1_i1:110-2005(+)
MGCGLSAKEYEHVSGGFAAVRTSTHATYRLRCSEREFVGPDKHSPAKLVIFDLDETLTLSTFMPKHLTFPPHLHTAYTLYNFASPFVEGGNERLNKLKKMLDNMVKGSVKINGRAPCRRVLAVLTRNGGGLRAVMGLLEMAGLASYFSCVWIMPLRDPRLGFESCGTFQYNGKWQNFDPPHDIYDHKADVVHDIAARPEAWFPQFRLEEDLPKGQRGKKEWKMKNILPLRPEQIVLVDDQRANFQSPSGRKVVRYAKVARYDADYRTFGFIKDMGGIGAHTHSDFECLERFVEFPWLCRETLEVTCMQRHFEESHKKRMVALVVFDFDETLTIATFMPKDPACATVVGWTPSGPSTMDNLSKADLVTYNFETPWVKGSRVEKLKKMLNDMTSKGRSLAVLTKNETGVVGVLNLLMMAGLADYFSAIWTTPWRDDIANGAYQTEDGQWKLFDPPVSDLNHHKADILRHVVEEPELWFPQKQQEQITTKLNGDTDVYRSKSGSLEAMPEGMEGVVLVDDERTNFRSDLGSTNGGNLVLRYCKVPRYDDTYRDCGLLNQMGGIGAHSDKDYASLLHFIKEPWQFPWPTEDEIVGAQPEIAELPELRMGCIEDSAKSPRKRQTVTELKPVYQTSI